MKARAPPPPQAPQPAPRHIFRNSVPDGGGTSGMDTKENILRPTVDFQLTLPQGHQTSLAEDGSKALMDLLIELCSRYHLNPALHTLELLSPEGHTVGFKPNALLGSLNVACVLIKEKVWEEKAVRRPAPKVPEKTVRLMVNYHGGQKAVVRVNPLVPLQALIPVICDKCEFDPAHVLLLKDSISRHELQLDKSLTELEIKELYVHNQRLVLQPKMASAPALNYSDSICSSTTSLNRKEKKGFLGIFQFSRSKSKRETTSMDLGDCDDKVFQNTDSQSDGPSTSGVPSLEYPPRTFGQSQSVMDISRMSNKIETKKRRAPALPGAPTTAMGHTSSEAYQMGLSSESQQRKRMAPVPPPTQASITPGLDNISSSATPTLDSHATETPTPVSCAKVVQAATFSATTVVTQTLKTPVHPPPVAAAAQTPSSPNPSTSTTDSLAVQDSSSELSHSLDDSDPDLDQTSSQCSSLTGSTVSGSVLVQTATKCSSSRMEESEKSSTMAANLNQEATSASSSRLESESALNLKLDEVETNRQSAIGTTDRPAPPKPRRSPAQESLQLVLPPTLSSPPIEPTESSSLHGSMKPEKAAAQSWLHSVPSSTASAHKPDTETLEGETLSLGSSSGGSNLPDQCYDASEGMGEDSGMVSSPSDTLPTSPDGSFSLDGGCGGGGERLLGPVRDNSSDSDEGCATWGSRYRDNAITPKAKSGGLKEGYKNYPVLTAQLLQTLADFEADLADHMDIVSAKEAPYTMSTGSNMVPVSVVDMDVPVTAIDEVLNDYECKTAENGAKSITRTESAGSKGPGFCHQPSVELWNKNNNACTVADSNTKQPSQPDQHRKPLQNTAKGDKKEEKIEAKMKEMTITATNCVKKNKQRTSSTVKSNVDMQKHNNITEVKSNGVESNSRAFQEEKPVLSLNSQRTAPTERDEVKHSIYQNNSSSNTLHGKVTHNVASRFGMKTFTVIPPKPTVFNAATGVQAVTLTLGAIKIDEQGNLVKIGTSPNKVGGSSVSGTDNTEVSPLLGKAKAFWSSNERQENAVPHNKGLIDKAKENTDGVKYSPTAISENTLKTSNIEDLKMIQTSLIKPLEKAQPEVMVKEEAKESLKDIRVALEQPVEVDIPISMPKMEQNNKPTLPPSIPPDLRKDLSFLKASQRTSSQYVASAINKYTSKTSAKPNSIPNAPDFSDPLKRHAVGFQRSGRSIQVNPHQSSHLSDNKENESAIKADLLGPKRSMSFPEYVSDSLRDFAAVRPDGGGFEKSVGCIKGNPNTLETEKNDNKRIQSRDATQMNMGTNDDRDNIRHTWNRTPNLAQRNPPHSSAKLLTAPKTISQSQTSDTRDLTEAATHLTPDWKPQPSVSVVAGGVSCGPPPVTVFGPVKKFRPVICRSIEKDTSLHSSLMEAIQTGGGRLKTINTAGPRSMKKASYVEEENERSALLAGIRAQSSSGRLRKTKSEAAVELEKFRKASEEERSAGPSSPPFPPPLTCTSPVFTPPPPPPPMIPPPPPPPVMPQVKPSSVAKASANALTNPALAREAMLEAIRSGSAAERLKKVTVPTKTVKVNGRLGTIQANSSTAPQQ